MKKTLALICAFSVILSGCSANKVEDTAVMETTSEVSYDSTTVTTVEKTEGEIIMEGRVYPKVTHFVNKSEEVNYFNTDNKYSYSYTYYCNKGEDYKAVYELLYQGMSHFETFIEVPSDIKISFDDLSSMFYNMTMDNPELYYVSSDIDFAIDDDKNVTEIGIEYIKTPEEIAEINKSMQMVTDSIREQLPDDISEYDLLLYLHDYLIQNVVYDESYSCNTAVECLVLRYATCQGFALGYSYLCKQFGLSPALVGGEAGAPHVWNALPYGDGYIAIDVGMDNSDSEVTNTWNLHTMFGVTNQFLVETANHVLYTEDSTSYIVTPEASLSGYSYYEIADKKNTISGDVETAKNQLITLLTEAVESGVYYVDVKSPDYDEYKKSLLVIEEGHLSDIITQVNRNTSVKLDTRKIGVSKQGWNDSFVIYVFEEGT